MSSLRNVTLSSLMASRAARILNFPLVSLHVLPPDIAPVSYGIRTSVFLNACRFWAPANSNSANTLPRRSVSTTTAGRHSPRNRTSISSPSASRWPYTLPSLADAVQNARMAASTRVVSVHFGSQIAMPERITSSLHVAIPPLSPVISIGYYFLSDTDCATLAKTSGTAPPLPQGIPPIILHATTFVPGGDFCKNTSKFAGGCCKIRSLPRPHFARSAGGESTKK